MFPSASIVRSFEPMQVVTKSGKVYNGLVHKDAPDELVLIASATETDPRAAGRNRRNAPEPRLHYAGRARQTAHSAGVSRSRRLPAERQVSGVGLDAGSATAAGLRNRNVR